jgi:hypothetical protein
VSAETSRFRENEILLFFRNPCSRRRRFGRDVSFSCAEQ